MEEDKKDNGGYEAEGNALVGLIRGKFQQAETSKIYDEKRWLKAYRNYRGLYGPEMALRENERSRVFVKITKTKVLASFGQIIEVLFSQGKFPLGVSPTSVPEDIAERANLKPKEQQQASMNPYGFNGDGAQIPPGATVLCRSNGTETVMTILEKGYATITDSNSPYAIVAGAQVFANTTANPIEIDLPASPAVGDEVTVIDTR